MFFIGIFGVENKQKEIKILKDFSCKNCNSISGGTLIKTFNFFHLFFIPLFRWNEKYYVVCNGCNSVYEIPENKGKDIENNENVEITYWDLKSIETNHDNANYLEKTKCQHCGHTVEERFQYCPYCGKKMK